MTEKLISEGSALPASREVVNDSFRTHANPSRATVPPQMPGWLVVVRSRPVVTSVQRSARFEIRDSRRAAGLDRWHQVLWLRFPSYLHSLTRAPSAFWQSRVADTPPWSEPFRSMPSCAHNRGES